MTSSDTSVSLAAMGSFFVGGGSRSITGAAPRDYVLTRNGVPVRIDPNGTAFMGQMYVQYFKPANPVSDIPLAFWHGGSLTGATWESTPDGRQGWLQYFLGQRWTVFNSDAVERGRSGWAPFDVRFSANPILRTAEDTFYQFRIGKKIAHASLDDMQAAAFGGCQFPLHAFDSLMRQVVPRWADTDDLVLEAYVALLEKIGPVVLVAHSQGGAFAFRAAEMRPDKVKAIVAIEPAQGGSEGLHSTLVDTPVLAVYGDHIDSDDRWRQIRARSDRYFDALRSAGGTVEIIDLPKIGMNGNSHMLMMERNNLDIAAMIQAWLARHIPGTGS